MSSLSTPIERVHAGVAAVELVYTSHDKWPLPVNGISEAKLRISVLDSSFNPPTLAHLALVNAPLTNATGEDSTSTRLTQSDDYEAKLLLLSVRNADKKMTPGDATYVQRLEMMILLADDIVHPSYVGEKIPRDPDRVGTVHSNVAVAIIDEPTFVGKSKKLLMFLRHRLSSVFADSGSSKTAAETNVPTQGLKPQLTFLAGMDTLERLFEPRYYQSGVAMLDSLRNFFSSKGDDARVVCARRVTRGALPKEDEAERKLMYTIQEFLQTRRITVVDINENERTISSTQIRELVRAGDITWTSMVTSSVAEFITKHGLYRCS
ncbi:hypothetical protein AcW1_007974 [Taiwanofungus camphoratus]|nr:hypothetical protein AcV5_008265 [Antrodia cinnamomea]KAI0950744.1 hypothetical protein AcW1_007974 [Antrodia cinnamomea]KAI0955653.1 hypothetical protein AcV7_006262 [Antrodia cinnamomea]